MYRKKIENLIEWKNKKNKKPLIIKGARQVGKTWLIKEFGKKYYDNYAYINFDNNERMKTLFSGDFNIDRIIQGLKIETGVNIEKENTLVIFDEIQEVPSALSSLKYFYENEPEYNIISAGSLLGIALHTGTSFPVGKVEFMTLSPLNFNEYLLAIGEENLNKIIEDNNIELIKVFKDKIINYLKEYLYIGGLPEVVNSYVSNKDYNEVKEIQKRLLDSYENDFSKHAPVNIITRIREVWNNIPSQLGKENKKFIYGLIKKGARAREYETAINWLIDAGLIYKIHRVNDYKKPLKAYQDLNAFKLYIFDTGLLSAMINLNIKTLIEKDEIFTEFKGSLTEEYVLEELKSSLDTEIFYWSNIDGIAEIDYMIEIDNNIIPIEVKSGENLQAKSLKSFIKKYNSPLNIRTSLREYKKEENIINIPLYMINNLKKNTRCRKQR